MSSRTRTQLENWMREKSVKGNVLDVGGSQLPINKRINIAGETYFHILDLPVPHKTEQPPAVEWDLNEPITFESKFDRLDLMGAFDYAVCLEVSEYWWDPMEALKNIALLMKQDGILYISFHFIYPVHNPTEEDCTRYTRRGAMKMLEKAGFDIVEVVSRTADDMSFSNFFVSEAMRPAKGYRFHNEVGTLITAKKK